MKKTFVLHTDSLDVIEELTDEQAGKLFKAIAQHNRGEEVVIEDLIVKIAFIPIMKQLIRDGEAYDKVVKRNQENGKNGGRPKKETEVKEVSKEEAEEVVKKTEEAVKEEENKPKKTAKNIKNKTEEVKEEIPSYEEVFEYVTEKAPFAFYEYKLKLKYEAFKSNNWRDANDKPIKNWKTKFINQLQYFKDETKDTTKKLASYDRNDAIKELETLFGRNS